MTQLVGLHADVNNGDRLLGIDEVLVHGTEEAAEDAGVLHLLPFHTGLVVDGYEVIIPKSPDLEGRDVGKADVPRLHSSVGDSLVVDGQVRLVEEPFLQERPEQHDAAAAEEHDSAPSHNQMIHVLVHVEDVDAATDEEDASQKQQQHPPERMIYLDFFHRPFHFFILSFFIFLFFPQRRSSQ